MSTESFSDFMRRIVGPKWVVARRTKRILRWYGDDVVCLSEKRYAALQAEWRKDTEDATTTALRLARQYIERLPAGYKPGQRSGPNEREVHAALVVAERKREEATNER